MRIARRPGASTITPKMVLTHSQPACCVIGLRARAPQARDYNCRMRHILFNALVEFAGAFARSTDDSEVRRRVRPLERLTRWEMPDHDASIRQLTDDERQCVADVWAGRCVSEAGAVAAFAHIVESLEVMEAPAAVVSLGRRAIADERRHIEICRRVASAYEGVSLSSPAPRTIQPPVYDDGDCLLQALLRVIGQCCLNETTACAFARQCRLIAKAPLVRAALREILADEVDHARIGWAALASAPAALRQRVAVWLPQLITSHLAGWRVAAVKSSAALIAHGIPATREAAQIVSGTMDDLILPGFAALGVPLQSRRFL